MNNPSFKYKMGSIDPSRANSPLLQKKMAETYTYLATSPEANQTTGTCYDDPQYIATSSAYSRNPENIEQLMTLTRTFIQTPMVVSLDPARYWHNEQL